MSATGGKAQLVFARSADLAANMNEILKATCQAVGVDLARVEEALVFARRLIRG